MEHTNHRSLCRPLHTLTVDDLPYVGNKAGCLADLMRAGFRVPPGFCITAAAYTEHIRANSIEIGLVSLGHADEDQVRDHLLSLRTAIYEAPLPAPIEQAIVNVYQGGIVAVRSSATAEDLPEASFAGQYDTILGVHSLTDCLTAVKSCWASLWTDRAFYYREQNHIAHDQLRMAVIVQQQVAAEAAGVAFSVDPITQSRLRIVIEACQGLGEDLVSGKVTPVRWIWRKQNLVVIKRTEEDPPVLTHRVAKRLARLVRRLEKKLGAPQDVEWALRGKRIYLLQARPITTLSERPPWQERQAWTNLNLGEVVPDVTTPLSFSLFEPMFIVLFKSLCRLLGADIHRAPIMGRVAGRLYFNINTGLSMGWPFFNVVRQIPDADSDLNKVMGGHQQHIDIAEEDLPDMGFSWGKFLALVPVNLWALFRHRPARGRAFLAAFVQHNRDLAAVDSASLTAAQLAAHITHAVDGTLRYWDLLFLVTGTVSLPVLEWVNEYGLKETDGALMQRLFSGQGGMADTEAGLELWRLAQRAHQSPDTEAAILSGRDWCDIESCLHPDFVEAWQRFMTEHGHHCRGELEAYNPRWSEQPNYILQVVRSYLQSLDQADPVARQLELRAESERLVVECERRLSNPLKRWVFRWALRQSRDLAQVRENWKNQAVVWVAALRRCLLLLGERLCEQGVLSDRDDVFFLTFNELQPVAEGRLDVRARVVERRREYAWNGRQNPAAVVVGTFDPERHTARPVAEGLNELQGLAVSPGCVTGPARVILRSDDHHTVSPGEILVAPFTDPAWTPYFVPAAGVVMDLGGVLSHGSIIAREYGLPAVVNVGCATQVIKTGQIIEVDGDRGVVRCLDHDTGVK